MYIYKTTCLINGKIYVGQCSKTPESTEWYLGSGTAFERALRKFTSLCFIKDILCYCGNQKLLNKMEIHFIKKLDAKNKKVGYNLTDGGQGEDLSSPMLNPEIALKCSKTKKGKCVGPDNPNWNNKWGEHKREEMSNNKKILWQSGEHNMKPPPNPADNPELAKILSERLIKLWQNPDYVEERKKMRGKFKWSNNGIINVFYKVSDSLPEGFVIGRLKNIQEKHLENNHLNALAFNQ